jgi:hypothetical protein
MVYGLYFMVFGLWFTSYGLWFMVLQFMVYGLSYEVIFPQASLFTSTWPIAA